MAQHLVPRLPQVRIPQEFRALILLATTWPMTDFQDHAHWDAVEWIPFTHYFGPFDLVANVMLFVPFGLAVGWGGTTHRRVLWALALGITCSLAVEFACEIVIPELR